MSAASGTGTTVRLRRSKPTATVRNSGKPAPAGAPEFRRAHFRNRTERAPYKASKGGRRLACAMTSDITLRPIDAAKLTVSKGRNVSR